MDPVIWDVSNGTELARAAAPQPAEVSPVPTPHPPPAGGIVPVRVRPARPRLRDPAFLARSARECFSNALQMRFALVRDCKAREVFGRRFFEGQCEAHDAQAYRQRMDDALALIEAALDAGATQAQLPWIFGQLLVLSAHECPHRLSPEAFDPSSQVLESDEMVAKMRRLADILDLAPEGTVRDAHGDAPGDLEALVGTANARFARLRDERREATQWLQPHGGLRSMSYYDGEILPTTGRVYRSRLDEALDLAERALAAGATPEQLADVANFVAEVHAWTVPHRIAPTMFREQRAVELETEEVLERIEALARRL